MLNRQVYRREILRVEHPQLELVTPTQPITEFHSARKLFGNRKNRLSPEFSFGDSKLHLHEEAVDAKRRTPVSMTNMPGDLPKRDRTPKPLPRDKASTNDLPPVESDRLRLLKDELRRKNEEIRRLLFQNDHFQPQKPSFPASMTPVPQRISSEEPFAKVKSVTPVRQRDKNDSSFLAEQNSVRGENKGGDTVPAAMRQVVFTTKSPKIHSDNPITGKWHVGVGRHQLQDWEVERRKGFAECGTMQISPLHARRP